MTDTKFGDGILQHAGLGGLSKAILQSMSDFGGHGFSGLAPRLDMPRLELISFHKSIYIAHTYIREIVSIFIY